MKRVRFILLAMVMILTMSVSAFAAGSVVSYKGHEEGIVFSPDGMYRAEDLFDNFKDVMPGDRLTEVITVQNDAKNNVKIKLYLRSLGAQEGTEAFLNQMNLQVTQHGESTLFDAPAGESAGLTDWTCLGTIYSGGNITLDVTLEVPLEMGNDFANEIGYVDWQFRVEEFPKEPGDPAPDTGDDRPITLYLGLMGLCVAVGILAVVVGKKKKAQ